MKINRIMSLVAFLVVSVVLHGQTVAFDWKDTWNFSGCGTVSTEPFRLFGESWNVRFAPKGDGPFEIHLHNARNGFVTEISKQMTRGRVVGGTKRGSGKAEWAYLEIAGSELGWNASVVQYLDVPNEWRFRKWDSPANHLKPFGSWTGEPGDREMTVEVSAECGRISVRQFDEGRLRVDVLRDGAQIAHLVSAKPGTMNTWYYAPGAYVLRISAIDTEWTIDVTTFDYKDVEKAAKR